MMMFTQGQTFCHKRFESEFWIGFSFLFQCVGMLGCVDRTVCGRRDLCSGVWAAVGSGCVNMSVYLRDWIWRMLYCLGLIILCCVVLCLLFFGDVCVCVYICLCVFLCVPVYHCVYVSVYHCITTSHKIEDDFTQKQKTTSPKKWKWPHPKMKTTSVKKLRRQPHKTKFSLKLGICQIFITKGSFERR